jgi:hypothetical protein
VWREPCEEMDRLVVVERLAPGDEGETGEGLGLEFEGKVEVLGRFSHVISLIWEKSYLYDGVDTEWNTACDTLATEEVWSCLYVQIDHRISIVPGRPSVFFRR